LAILWIKIQNSLNQNAPQVNKLLAPFRRKYPQILSNVDKQKIANNTLIFNNYIKHIACKNIFKKW
jgi:hypothetical protein